MSLLGIHCSISGGLENAFIEAASLGLDTFQIFTQNQRQWINRKIDDETRKTFKNSWDRKKVRILFSHCSYLLNLASEDTSLRKKSTDALTGEVNRCERLGLSYCVLHPGAAKDQDEKTALKNVITHLKQVLKATADCSVMILIENTAGQGSSIGHRFEHLHTILQGAGSARIGICLDTCHAFAAGYDLRTQSAFEDALADFDKVVGLSLLKAVHLNDSRGDLGSRIDRHEHIGKGKIGIECFRQSMKHFKSIPKVIETKKEDDMDRKNVQLLRSL